jgi:formiminotetrahydrofolate cyclodeaminase
VLYCGRAVLHAATVDAPQARRAGKEELVAENGEWTIAGLAGSVADPERYVGGGAVAAMSLAGAAATIELVTGLSARRKRVSEEDRKRLTELLELAQSLRTAFLTLIDTDIKALEALMETQRQLRRARKSGDSDALQVATIAAGEAVEQAIAIPLEAADRATELLEATVDAIHLAVPFTMSDLGAACATIRGGVASMLLMAEVNVGLMSNEVDQTRALDRIEALFGRIDQLDDRAISTTRERIRPEKKQSGE